MDMEPWKQVSNVTIKNCWKHSGIIGSNYVMSDPEDEKVDDNLTTLLKDLELEDSLYDCFLDDPNPEEMENAVENLTGSLH